MAVDTTQLVFYPNLDHLHNQLGRLCPDVPSPGNLDSRLSQCISGQIDHASQMTFHPYMVDDFSRDHAFFFHSQNFPQDQQWTAKQICSPRLDASPSSLLLSPQPQTFNQQYSDHHMACMERSCQIADIAEHTSPDTFMHSHQLQLKSFPVRHVRYQSSLDFGDDLLRNSHDMVNEELFAEWYLGHGEQDASQPNQNRSIQWRTASGFASHGDSATTPISGNSVNPGPVTHLKSSEKKEPDLITSPRGDSNEFYKLKPRLLASRGEHPIIWPVLRTQTSPIDADVVSTDRDLSLEYLNFTLHKGKPRATVRPQREKLSKAQKRRNHILHEQKRRAMIKDGFEDLLNLVPDLKGQGLSKSVILFKAAEWLRSLASGNEALRAQTRVLEGTSLRPVNGEVTGVPAIDG